MIVNVIDCCQDASHTRRGTEIIGCAVHRFGVPGIHDACGVARFSRHEVSAGIGRRMPYHFVIAYDGTIEQALALSVYGNHAKGHNRTRFGIALLGDFQVDDPSPAQVDALTDMLAVFIGAYRAAGKVFAIDRHDRLGSADPSKVCPGKRLEVERIALAAAAINSKRTLAEVGIV